MSFEFNDNAVCFAGGKQWFVWEDNKGTFICEKNKVISRLLAIESDDDFQLNEPRIGDYIEKSELDTEQKYNDVVEVFGLFGFYFKVGAVSDYCELIRSDLLGCFDDGLWQASVGNESNRKLTYNQLMAIGKLKRLIDEREKGRFIIGESDEGLENAITDSVRNKSNDNTEITFNVSGNLLQDFAKHIKDIESDIYNAANKPVHKADSDNTESITDEDIELMREIRKAAKKGREINESISNRDLLLNTLERHKTLNRILSNMKPEREKDKSDIQKAIDTSRAEVSADNVKNPNHYQLMDGVESIEIIARSMTQEQWKGFCLGNMLKYRIRAGKKDALQQDIDKANFYGELYEMHKEKCYD